MLTRAYQITTEEAFLKSAALALEPFKRDIFDGGVSTPVGEDGLFFQDDAIYPATYVFTGCVFALLGLYDYVTLVDDADIRQLIERCLKTLHSLFDEFDAGFWTRRDLDTRQLAAPEHLLLQARLLATLAKVSGCEHCGMLASRWEGYQKRTVSRLRFRVSTRFRQMSQKIGNSWQRTFFPKEKRAGQQVRVAVTVFGFPSMGGTRAVLAGVAQAMSGIWQIEYLTQAVYPHTEPFVIHKFGTKPMAPWQFPAVWLYVLAGARKLLSLLHHQAGYSIIMPQDGVYSAAFSAIAGRLAGVRVVCIDHGSLTLLDSRAFR